MMKYDKRDDISLVLNKVPRCFLSSCGLAVGRITRKTGRTSTSHFHFNGGLQLSDPYCQQGHWLPVCWPLGSNERALSQCFGFRPMFS